MSVEAGLAEMRAA